MLPIDLRLWTRRRRTRSISPDIASRHDTPVKRCFLYSCLRRMGLLPALKLVLILWVTDALSTRILDYRVGKKALFPTKGRSHVSVCKRSGIIRQDPGWLCTIFTNDNDIAFCVLRAQVPSYLGPFSYSPSTWLVRPSPHTRIASP